MRWDDGRFEFSPSDLTELIGCAHASALSRAVARGEQPKVYATGRYAELIFAKGNEHEQAYLASLRAAGRNVREVEFDRDYGLAATRTAELMRAGVDVIYQGVFVVEDWRGVADFVERVETPSGLGAWSYEALDTKLARVEARPSHALQLCFYSEGIEQAQGVPPRFAHLVLGSGLRESIRVREIAAYFRQARSGLERAAAEDLATEAYPCEACAYCAFRSQCESGWLAADHLTRVAGIRRDEVALLRAGGVPSRGALAALAPGTVIPEMRERTLDALQQQARLQVTADAADELPYEFLSLEAGRGFARLPDASPGDVMFDIEGDPFFTPASDLTFLFGLLLADAGGWRYEAIWAHNEDEERVALERVIDLIDQRLARHPEMHVYHYSPAEPGVLQRLMARHATREAEVDDLLRRGVLVDLYTVVKQAMRIGVESYSLKQVERLAGFSRSAEVGSGADAVLAYEAWRTSGSQAELEGIARYNAEDCEATLALRDWLLERRPSEIPPLAPVPERVRTPEAIARDQALSELRAALVDGQEPGSVRWLAGELLEYHRREARPGWWRWYSLLGMDTDELIGDAEAIGGLEPIGPPVTIPHNIERMLRFPPQRQKLAPGDSVHDPADESSVSVAAVDEDACTITLRARCLADGFPHALIPGRPIKNYAQRDALCRIAESVRSEDGRFPAIVGILRRDQPRFDGRTTGNPVQTTDLDQQKTLARTLDRSCFLVQGPPGTGKTFTGARLIVDLIREGKRVGVTAFSHRAINNLLAEVEVAAGEAGVTFRGARKKADHPAGSVPDGGQITNVASTSAILTGPYELVAGTTWLFAPADWDDQLDYLVIDEAGQLSLADALAAGTAATNLILLGDPLQLPQVSQATHPPGTNASILEHLLGSDATVAEDRGIFLTETWRMHPDVCRFISEEVYEGRLTSEQHCAVQTTGAGTGIRYLPVVHHDNASQSREEAAVIRELIASLVGQPYTDRAGATRPLRANDVMVVSPYNSQVRLLRHEIQAGVRVGTVDAFQGQEAPIVIFSMATSSGDEIPRDIAFLFSRNRLNVAISRARCLAILCCSPALLETRARTIEEMRLVSTLCALVEYARAAREVSTGTAATG